MKQLLFCTVLLAVLLCVPVRAAEPWEGTATADCFVYGDFSLPYLLHLPGDYDETKQYPLMLFFHGAGERGNDLSAAYSPMIRSWVEGEGAPLEECIVLIPQCPEEMQWVDTPWAEGNYSLDQVPESLPMQAAMALLDQTVTDYTVDFDRLYVSGYSMGGFAAWDVLMRHGERFAAGLPVCGGADPSYAGQICDIPIITLHGSADSAVPVEGTREMAAAIKGYGPLFFTYVEIPGRDHDLDRTLTEDHAWVEKLLAFRLSDRLPIEEAAVTTDRTETPPDEQGWPDIPLWQFGAVAVVAAVISTAAVEMKRRQKTFKKSKKAKK